jgi:TonB-linked SusC/RagA family outer membrane protein
MSQEGLVKATDYERFSMRANVDVTLSDMFSAGVRLSPTYSKRKLSSVGGQGRYEAGFGYSLVASPLEPVYEDDGSYNVMTPDAGDDTGALFPYPNPLQALEQLQRDRETLRGIASVFLNFNPIESVTIETRLNADWQDEENKNFNPSTVGALFQPPPVEPTGSYVRSGYHNWLSETTLSYDNTLGEMHNISALTGITFQSQTDTYANISGGQFPGDEVRTLNAASDISGQTLRSEWGLLSFLGRVDYNYDGRYIATATIRRDGSSRFGGGNRWGTFPSLALGWRLSEEAFLQDVDFLSNLKLRASFGQNGNFNIGNFPYAGAVGISNYVIGGSIANGRTVNSLQNPNLGWEQTREYNIGVDAGFFDSRLTANIELYRRITTDLLLDVNVPQSSGFASSTQNRGEIQNQGIEVTVNSANFQGEEFSWDTKFNIASNANEVLSLGPDDEPIIAGDINAGRPTHITKVGEPIGQFYGWDIEGLYNSQEEIDNNASYDDAQVGNIRAYDTNGDGELNRGDDFTELGNPYPDFTFGLTNNVQFQNFDLRVLLSGSYGGKRMQASHEWLWNIDGVFNVTEEYIEDRWRSPEDPGDGVTPKAVGPSTNRLIYRDPNSLSVQDNSHIWVKNITLGYTLPSSLLRNVARQARVYASVRNAFVITGYEGGNPQATNYGGTGGDGQQLTPGLDYSTYPVPRTFTVGAKLSF